MPTFIPAPTPTPAPTVVTPILKWAEQLRVLVDMGFCDMDRSVDSLERCFAGPGGLEAVIDDLLSQL